MFIEKLTDTQIKDFLHNKYPKYHVQFSRDDSSILASITNPHSLPDDYTWNERYYDFSTSVEDGPWVRYLAKLFGEEYKDAYKADCVKLFD